MVTKAVIIHEWAVSHFLNISFNLLSSLWPSFIIIDSYHCCKNRKEINKCKIYVMFNLISIDSFGMRFSFMLSFINIIHDINIRSVRYVPLSEDIVIKTQEISCLRSSYPRQFNNLTGIFKLYMMLPLFCLVCLMMNSCWVFAAVHKPKMTYF